MKFSFSLICLFLSCASFAQLKLSGVVVDQNNQPLPFVNVYIENTTEGDVTNENGLFSFITTKKRGNLEISFMGYTAQSIRFTAKKNQFSIMLVEESNQLDEIIIVSKPKKRLRKKENPAYRILKEVWKRKKTNGLKLFDAYQYTTQKTTEIGLNNLDTLFLKKVFTDKTDNTITRLPVDNNGINFYIPLFMSEDVIEVYGNNILNKEREVIIAEKSEGVNKNGFIFDRMANTFNDIDIFNNSIELLKKSFVSPISSAGFDSYDYVLHDSLVVDDKKFYSIYFFPRRNGDLAFEGNMVIADKNFSISKIKMKVNKEINLNFVRGVSFEKEFFVKDDSIYLPKKDKYMGDFVFVDKDDSNKGLTIKKTLLYSDYVFDKALDNKFYDTEVIRYKPNQFEQDQAYWDSINTSTDKKSTYTLIDDVKNNKKIKQISGILNTLSTGYINLVPGIQLGQYWNTVVGNSVEGTKLKLGFRTFKSDDDRFRLSGFVGYGIKDKRFKFGTEAKYLISYKPRIAVGAAYLYDVEQLGAKLLNTNRLNANVFDPNALFSRGENYFLSFVNKSVVKFDIEAKKNLHVGFSIAHTKISSASPSEFSIDYVNEFGGISSRVTDVSTDLYLAYTPGRFEYGFGVEQKMGRNLYPSLVINYKRGYKNFLDGDFNYDKIQIKYSQPIILGKIGILVTTAEVGKTFGTVPIALLSPVPANQTYWLTKNTFSLMNYYDYVTDSYVYGDAEHHFNGFILNRIPLINRLKLRSIISFKGVYGTISDENIAINRSNISYAAPSNKLYYEYGFGFENIGYKDIRPLRVDFLWRGDHTSVNGLPSPKFAVRVGIKAGF
ncbi:membrane protein [Polaribacter pacificus]|uniref:Membrane protein n=1 Tax=Polaribacter pacificus TaxID=1775173 RepID=A0A917HXF9_9FLAO|nr:DUF5686 and carboxypeptidase-like regulatory domain-containing protein [Polaribacter pacificus]GGG96339.1 membrane protein [Polaribacter pacificus]